MRGETPERETRLGRRAVPSLLAAHLGDTIEFYTEVLGFEMTGCYPDAESPRWIELSRDGAVIQFYDRPHEGEPMNPTLSGTLYFFPESVDALADELRPRVSFEWGPEVMGYGMREFAVRDPNGYLVAFTEPA